MDVSELFVSYAKSAPSHRLMAIINAMVALAVGVGSSVVDWDMLHNAGAVELELLAWARAQRENDDV